MESTMSDVTENGLNITMKESTLNSTFTSSGFNSSLLIVLEITGTVILILYILGLFVNIIAFIVLIRAKKKISTEYLFTGLTFADMIALVSGILISVVYTLIAFSVIPGDLFDLRNIVSRIDIVSYMGPYSITIVVSVERMFAVFKPVDFRNLWTPKMAKATVAIGYISTLSLYITLAATLNKDNFLLTRLIFVSTSVIVVVVVNIITIIRLKRHVKIEPENSNQGNISSKALAREKRLTKVLIGISTLFIICGSATIADTTLSMLHQNDFEFAFVLFMSGSARALFQIINSTLNCVIYVATNPHFRQQYVNILLCRK